MKRENRIVIDLLELAAIEAFLGARSPSSSARDIRTWCEARAIDRDDLLRWSGTMNRSCLATIGAAEERLGHPAPRCTVEAALVAAIVSAFQTGVDAERRRRDAQELE